MYVDRLLQNQLLQYLNGHYPHKANLRYLYFSLIEKRDYPKTYEEEMALLNQKTNAEQFQHFRANLCYLKEHGLVQCTNAVVEEVGITAKGIDFLANDGGLSAILTVQTIKFHEETWLLLRDTLENIGFSATEKETFLTKMKALPADAIRQVLLEWLSKGAQHIPDLFSLIGK